jgi:hypothetical protein
MECTSSSEIYIIIFYPIKTICNWSHKEYYQTYFWFVERLLNIIKEKVYSKP